MRRHAASRSLLIKHKNGIRCASRLESANLLEILALKEQGRLTLVIQPRIRQDGCAMNA
jgi:hypothetical protein